MLRVAPEGDMVVMGNSQAGLSFVEDGMDQVAIIVPDLEEAMTNTGSRPALYPGVSTPAASHW